MPRELTHWLLLEKAISLAKAEGLGELAALVEKNRAFSYLGAVAHDAPCYYRFGGRAFEEVARVLHGRFGNDTFRAFLLLPRRIRAMSSDKRDRAWAFLLGMLSHWVLDSRVHPMVFHSTGNYYHENRKERDAARARHRMFEVYLDSWTRNRFGYLLGEYSIRRLIKAADPGLDAIWVMLGDSVGGEFAGDEGLNRSQSRVLWKASFGYMAWIQRLFLSGPVGAFVRFSCKTFLPGIAPIDALFSFGRKEPPAFFDERIRYRDPISGDELEMDVRDMLDECAERLLSIWRLFAPLVLNVGSGAGDIREVEGVSLDFGRLGAKPEDARFFAAEAERPWFLAKDCQ